ncbi:MAG: TetR/AcrR family transcriptional regulator [Pseudomonadota bacterium]
MAGIQKAKREEAARKLLEAALTCVQENGMAALHAREIARRSGYSVGSVYKYYEDLDDILINVNSITLGRIRATIEDAVAGLEDPLERLKRLAHAYHAFARGNTKLWEALFGHQLPEGRTIPDEHREQNIALLSIIGRALSELNPSLSQKDLEARTRSCFAAVHGVVLINIENRFVGLEGDTFDREMDFVVEQLARDTRPAGQ